MDMEMIRRRDARLIILRALSEEADETLSSSLLMKVLQRFGIRKSRDWVHGELKWLADMGAVTLVDVGSVLVATLTEHGARHVRREIEIDGIDRPSRPAGM